MRVTSNAYTNSLSLQLSRLTSRQAQLQSQASSGQRIQLPADDPAATARVLNGQTEARQLSQFQANIGQLQDQAQAAAGVIKGLKKLSDRAGEIATLADGTKSPTELKLYASEVTQLIQQAVGLGNTQHNGEYLFGGTKSDAVPFTTTTDANGNVIAATYVGNDQTRASEVDTATTLSAMLPGANASGAGQFGLMSDSRTGADFLNHLISLQNNLLAGDTSAIATTDLPQLVHDEDNLLFHLGSNGMLQSRLEATDSLLGSRNDSVRQTVSRDADADLAETLLRLNQTQTAYQAALQTGATIMNQSLLDYIR